MKLVLASGSATRRALLRAALWPASEAVEPFIIQHPVVDETAIKLRMQAAGALPAFAALALADAKAKAVSDAGGFGDDVIVVGADQILVCGERWFDKPRDLAEAAAQLRVLRGQTHTLATAVVCWQGGAPVWRHSAAPLLTMRAFSDDFLAAYLAAEGDACLSSVGAYRLEGPGVQLFSAVEGEHSAILGLPLLPLLAFLRTREGLLQ